MPNTPKRRWTDKWIAPSVKFSFAALTIIFFVILLMFGMIVHRIQRNALHINQLVTANNQLAHANADRIHDIQQSRLESCQRTYEGIREVFRPLYPPVPRTTKQIDDIETFNTTINKLKAHCTKQIHSGG